VRIVCEADLSLCLSVDCKKLVRAVGALLQNGVKFTPDGGEVVVRVSEEAPWVHFAVSDTGVGVQDRELVRIFEPFYGGGETGHHRSCGHAFGGGGLGVGLPMARTIAEAHGGRVSYSPRPEGGSIFVLSVPISSDVGDCGGHASASSTSGAGAA
jgi:signal transduction histidine kinase